MANVLKLIESFPMGRCTGALMRLIDVDMLPRRKLAVLRELEVLAREGMIELGKDGKWRARSRRPGVTAPNSSMDLEGRVGDPGDPLLATPARFVQIPSSAEENDIEEPTAQKPDPQALLRYYRSALRSDPRGALTQIPERHGTGFQLVTGNGKWWAGDGTSAQMRMDLDKLPAGFREALSRRAANENTLAVGWPIAIGRKYGAPAIWPVGMLAAQWSRDENTLIVTIESDNILVNPDWMKTAVRTTAWSLPALREVFLVDGAEGLPREAFRQRLKEAMARSIRDGGGLQGVQPLGRLDPAAEGIHDAVALFLPSDSSFTSGAVRDLDRIATWSPDRLSRTALASFLGLDAAPPREIAPALNLGPLNAEQILAVETAMSEPLTVVTGPPGTGKSQTIVAMVASALAEGQRVLVASKNHQALDAVEDRLSSIAPGADFMVRTLNPAQEVDIDIRQVLEALVRNPPPAPAARPEAAARASLHALAKKRRRALELIEERRCLNLQLADHLERRDAIARALQLSPDVAPVARPSKSWLVRLIAVFMRWRGEPRGVESAVLPSGADLPSLDAEIARDRARLAQLDSPADPVALTEEIASLSRTCLSRLLASIAHIDEETRLELTNALRDADLHGATSLGRDLLERVLAHRPLWLASVLGTPKRIDLHEGLFDLVIFDEASQCDIASALPLLARARRAVVVGDDRQLPFIPQIGAAQDRNLMEAQGLPRKGMGRFAQGRVSLFDLARSTPDVPAIMLREQYRSAPGIVGYLNDNFYGGRLRVSADLEGLKVPEGARPGLAWTDVPGHAAGADMARNVNRAEVEAICAHLRTLLLDQGYEGTIGVIAPFRSQVHELGKAVQAALSQEVIERADLRVATVDGFQGQERDVILFSPTVCAGSPQSGVTFLQREWRRMNVAISRARAIAHVFGDLAYARSGKVRSLATLAARATEPPRRQGEDIFDSEWERIMDAALRRRGLDPQPQYEIAGRRLDFALFGPSGIKLDLEIDGRAFHQDIDGNRKLDDHWRDHQMRSLGWKVRRFWVDELKRDMEKCLDIVEQDLSQ